MLIAFIALPIRGAVAATVITTWGVIPVQILDGGWCGHVVGRGAGAGGPAPRRHRRVNVGQGAVITAQGIGASLSPLLGGFIAQDLGYRAAFALLGTLSMGSLIIWLTFRAMLRPAIAAASETPLAGDAV